MDRNVSTFTPTLFFNNKILYNKGFDDFYFEATGH